MASVGIVTSLAFAGLALGIPQYGDDQGSSGNMQGNGGPPSESGQPGGGQSSAQSGQESMESQGPPFSSEMVIAHAVTACLALVFFFPMGAISIRIIPSRLATWIHAAFQILGYTLFIAAFGLGVYIARQIEYGDFKMINEYHPVIGIIVFAFLSLQPILGIVHHLFFKKYSKRTVWSYAHIWIGRIFITLGIINGGLGLRLAGDASAGQEAAYGVIAGLIWLVWMGAAVFGEVKRLRRPAQPSAHQAQNDYPKGSYR
ncbi:MAG: hypothetical protein M1831_000176 [Alyxoria varia]|nr:MAG: hypothetical protein M1831_000176 [Alyxoria varia]